MKGNQIIIYTRFLVVSFLIACYPKNHNFIRSVRLYQDHFASEVLVSKALINFITPH